MEPWCWPRATWLSGRFPMPSPLAQASRTQLCRLLACGQTVLQTLSSKSLCAASSRDICTHPQRALHWVRQVPPNTRAVSNYLDHPMFGFRNFAALCVMRKPPKAHCGTCACCMTFPVDCCCILDPELSAYCAAFGVVRNPFDLDRSSAGSSGGPAAGASANFAMISLGSDTGNSIRGPSGHNGLVGIRSSIGQTSRWDWALRVLQWSARCGCLQLLSVLVLCPGHSVGLQLLHASRACPSHSGW